MHILLIEFRVRYNYTNKKRNRKTTHVGTHKSQRQIILEKALVRK